MKLIDEEELDHGFDLHSRAATFNQSDLKNKTIITKLKQCFLRLGHSRPLFVFISGIAPHF